MTTNIANLRRKKKWREKLFVLRFKVCLITFITQSDVRRKIPHLHK